VSQQARRKSALLEVAVMMVQMEPSAEIGTICHVVGASSFKRVYKTQISKTGAPLREQMKSDPVVGIACFIEHMCAHQHCPNEKCSLEEAARLTN
jgi:hypothetical protein